MLALLIIALFTHITSTQQACCVQHLDVNINGDHHGFHRLVTFNATVHHHSAHKHSPCTIQVSQLLPSGMYADPYELHSTPSLALEVDGTFDSESLATHAHPMLLRMTAQTEKEATFTTWRVPVHMRYDAPHTCRHTSQSTPHVCSMRSGITLPPAVAADTCSARVPLGPPVQATVPVGNVDTTTAVVGLSTAAAMSGALFVVLRVAFGL